jgi:G3E family GTPase
MTRPRKPPIPLTVVTGPYGAGKTTLINRALKHPAFANTAVILNEFGTVAIAGGLVTRADEDVIALGGGCICCAVRGELVDACEQLLRDLDNNRVAAIGRVVVEASESADPSAILAGIGRHPYLSLRFRADGIVAVIPAGHAAAFAAREDPARHLAMADVVAVSGATDRLEAVRAALAGLVPAAAVVDAANVDPAVLIGHGPFEAGAADVERWFGAPVETRVGGVVNVFTVTRDRAMSLPVLDRFLDFLAAQQGRNVIRLRGLVAAGEGETAVVEAIGGFLRPPYLVPARPGAPSIRFSVSAVALDRQRFESMLDAFLNEARIDTPDRAAMTENPLHIAGFSARSGR